METVEDVLKLMKEDWVLHFNLNLRKAYLCHSDVEKYKVVPTALFNRMKSLRVITKISQDFVSDIYQKSETVDWPETTTQCQSPNTKTS